MADLQATQIRQMATAVYGRITLPKKTAADDIQKGDFLKLTSGEVEKMDAAADASTFIGVSAMKSEDADGPQKILVYLQCIVIIDVESASYAFGAGLKGNFTNGTLEADGSANTIAHAWETKATTTSLRALVDVINLAKVFPVS